MSRDGLDTGLLRVDVVSTAFGFALLRADGAELQSHLDGSRHPLTREVAPNIQARLGPDIATAAALNTLRNLTFYLDTMRRIREAIMFGIFDTFRQEFLRSVSRPALDS